MSEPIGQPQDTMAELLPSETAQYKVNKPAEHFHEKYAGFWTRFWAYLIDLAIIGAISGIIIKPIYRVAGIEISNPSFLLFTPYKVTLLILFLLYFTLMTKFLQQTVGKMIMGIKVVLKSGEKLSWSTVIFRETIGRSISKLLIIPYVLVVFMPKKEALHDLFADTIVVHEHAFEKVIELKQVPPTDGQQLHENTIV